MSKFTVRQARMLKGYSQENMAKILGMGRNTYIKKENGESKFYVDEAFLFANVVSIPFGDIIFFNTNVPKNGT